MATYKGFTYNLAGATPPPWGVVENQLDKDLIDTIVLDCVSATKDTTNGHRHYRMYSSDGSITSITCEATTGYVTLASNWGSFGVIGAAGHLLFAPDGIDVGGVDGRIEMGDGHLYIYNEDGGSNPAVLRLHESQSGNVGIEMNGDGTIYPDGATNYRFELTGTSYAPKWGLYKTAHEDGDGARESYFTARGEQSGGEISTLAQIKFCHDGAADDQKGRIEIYTNDGADDDSPTLALTINSNQDIYSTAWQTWTPTVATIGGGTAPTFSVKTAYYKKIGKFVYFSMILNNSSGGTAGAGANTITVTKPVSSDFANTGSLMMGSGYTGNGATHNAVLVYEVDAATFSFIKHDTGVYLHGVDMNDANSRNIWVSGHYQAA